MSDMSAAGGGPGGRQCPSGHANPDSARYCIVCGASMAREAQDATAMLPPVVSAPTLLPPPPAAPPPEPPAPKTPEEIAAGRRRRNRVLGIVAGALAVLALAGIAAYFLLTAPVPDAMGKDLAAARATLTSAEFTVGSTTEDFSPTVDKGGVASQSPAAGGRARKGGPVALTISRGPAVVVPDLAGQMVGPAEKSLTTLTLTSDRQEQVSETVPEGQVIAQQPAPGTRVEETTPVTLVVSSGPPTTTLVVDTSIDSIVAGIDFADCDFAVTMWSNTYPSPTIVNREGTVLSSISGSWTASPSNGYYYPCRVIGEFPDTSVVESEYRVNLNSSDPEDNNLTWRTREELEASDWTWQD